MDAVKICAAGITVTLVLTVLRVWNPGFDLPMKLAATILLLSALLGIARPLIVYAKTLMETTAVKPYATLLLRALGVAVLTETASGICRECKEGAVASYVEMAGRLEILILCLPLMEEILDCVRGLFTL